MSNECIVKIKPTAIKEDVPKEIKDALEFTLRSIVPKNIKINVGILDKAVFFWLGDFETFESANTDLLGIFWINETEEEITVSSSHKQHYHTTWWIKSQIFFKIWSTFGDGLAYDSGIGEFTPERKTFEKCLHSLSGGSARGLQNIINTEIEFSANDPFQKQLLEFLLPPRLEPLSKKPKAAYENKIQLRNKILKYHNRDCKLDYPCDNCHGIGKIKDPDDYDIIEGMKGACLIKCFKCDNGLVSESHYDFLLKLEESRLAAAEEQHQKELRILKSIETKLNMEELTYVKNRF